VHVVEFIGKLFLSSPVYHFTGGSMTRALPLLTAISVLFVVNGMGQESANGSSPRATKAPCSEPEQKQLEFWVGEWELNWPAGAAGKEGHGTNSIGRVMDGCVVEENFSGGDSMHLRGMSLSTFDARTNKWKQTWVDNEGGYLDLVGKFKDGQLILAREATGKDGKRLLQRMVFKNITAKDLDWSWERSLDDGKTWQMVWPIHYRRKS
jgi:Protein of unknown function (DUF1579)